MLDSLLCFRHSFSDQRKALNQLLNDSVEITFVDDCNRLPSKEEIVSLFELVDKMQDEYSSDRLITEIEILLLLTIIQGIDINQSLQLHIDQWEKIELLTYNGTRLYIDSKNQFCDELICSLQKSPKEPRIFQLLNSSNALKCLNLFLVMNGYEYVVTRSKLKLIFGRFHYLRHGRIRGVREFLMKYFSCDTHIELLVKLRLVDSIHYNTMMRN